MKKVLFILLSLIIIFTISSCRNKPKELDFKGLINDSSEFKFQKPNVIEDTFVLNLNEDKNDYFKNNVVELTGIVPVSSYNIMINNQALFDLKEMFTKENFETLIVRRGYLDDINSKSQGVSDHKTGYDIDIYVKGHEWTDFEGNKEADKIINDSYKYGFVLRYTDKKDYQPYHYRYVGKVHAQIMHNENLTLNNYLNELVKFKDKQIYKMKDSNTYVYKVSKKDLVVPVGYKYSITSINNDYYIVDFNTDKSVNIKELDNYNGLIDKNVNQLNILYDLVLVNNDNQIPNINNSNLISLTKYLSNDNNSKYVLEEKVLQRLKPMLDEVNNLDRHVTYVTSAYRTFDEQKELYDNGEDGYVQTPNHSEHQTGLAFDLANSYKPNTEFLQTAQGLLVKNIAHNYGFILRYPSGKEDITGIKNEQWHFRYVGELHATYIYENNITFEEYLNTFELNKFYNVKFNDKEYVFYKTTLNNEKIMVFDDTKDIYYLNNNEYLIIKVL